MGCVIFKQQRLKKAELNYFQGKRALALKLAKPLLKVNNKEIAYAANRLSGLALYQGKKYQECLPLLERACQLGNYQHDWYNYTMALAYHNEDEKAEEVFKNVYRTKVESGYIHAASIPVMLFQFMRALTQTGKTEKARRKANELKQMYAGIGVLNNHNELARGLPAYHFFRKEITSLFDAKELAKWEKQYLKFD